MTLSTVDFPAPFGPIRPVIRPGGTSKDAPLTAWTPPNWRCRSGTVEQGIGGLAHPPVLVDVSGCLLRSERPPGSAVAVRE